jgi:membrane fusion protein (multidrug efflux system)
MVLFEMRRGSLSRLLRQSGLLGSCLALFLAAGCGNQEKSQAPPPPIVEVMNVIQKDVPVHSEWVATADGLVNATIRAQVTGYLRKQNYNEGDFVRAGQVLFEIDPRTFQAAVDESKGALEQAQGQRAQAEAQWATTKANLERVKPLAARSAVSKKDLDDATGAELSARAAVYEANAAIASAQAKLETSKLNLEFTRITSPIAGIAGIAKAQIGNLVGPGQIQELTTVSTVDPIKVYFSVSEREYMDFRKGVGAGGSSREKALALPLELILTDGTVYPHKGKLSLADRQVDPRTGTLKLGALFPNPGNLLRPGAFAVVRATMETKKGALLVPQRAVSELQGKFLVAVVAADNTVDMRTVTPAERVGSLWVIDQGLKPGETVVVEGVQKVRTGARAVPKPAEEEGVAPPANPSANPPAAPAKGEKR